MKIYVKGNKTLQKEKRKEKRDFSQQRYTYLKTYKKCFISLSVYKCNVIKFFAQCMKNKWIRCLNIFYYHYVYIKKIKILPKCKRGKKIELQEKQKYTYIKIYKILQKYFIII